jgi:opacity protein-like surface antigen
LSPEPAAWGKVSQTGALSLGVDFRDLWGIELVADSLEYRLKLNDVGTVGEYGMGVVIPYLRLRYPLGHGRWQPYVMTGVGVGYHNFNDATPAASNLDVDAKGISPVVGVGGGIEYFVARNFSFNFDMRWLYMWNQEVTIENTAQATGDTSALMFSLGFRVYLWEGKPHRD